MTVSFGMKCAQRCGVTRNDTRLYLGYDYPLELHERTVAYLTWVRELEPKG
jgi:hypothetical protein